MDQLRIRIKEDLESFFFYFSLDTKDPAVEAQRLQNLLETKLDVKADDEEEDEISMVRANVTGITKRSVNEFMTKFKELNRQIYASNSFGGSDLVNMYLLALLL